MELILSGTATATDVKICNLTNAPTAGTDIGGGLHVSIPADWQSRVLSGQQVPGCTYAQIESGVGLLVVDTVIAAVAPISSLSGVTDADLASFKNKIATTQLQVGIWGQSNAQGAETSAWPGDSRIGYSINGANQGFGPFASEITGPELGLGPALATSAGRNVYLSKAAIGGSNISQWQPQVGVYWPNVEAACLKTYQQGASTLHLCTMHGEADAFLGTSQASYLAQFQAFIAGYRAQVRPGQSIRVYVGMINDNIPYPTAQIQAIQAAQTQFVAADPNAQLLTSWRSIVPGHGDSLHYTATQQTTIIGPAFAAAIQANL